MRNHRLAFQIVGRAIKWRAVMRSIFAAAVMLSASTALVHAREVSENPEVRPGHGSMRAPVGHRQPTRGDVALARPAQSDKKIVARDNELLDPASSQNRVAGADAVPPGEDNLSKLIEQENTRIDRLIRSICRGC
jgi:hypothetical protein